MEMRVQEQFCYAPMARYSALFDRPTWSILNATGTISVSMLDDYAGVRNDFACKYGHVAELFIVLDKVVTCGRTYVIPSRNTTDA